MKSTNTYVPEVAKEKLTGMRFPQDDVLPLYDQRADRKRLLQRAADFGNYAQYKIVILFEDDESVKRVETTIWDIDDENIYLKNQIALPIRRILEVKI
jgi:hypothetical protein